MEKLRGNIPYYFDTNAIYYFCGENKTNMDMKSFRDDIKSLPNKIVPSCVLQEILIKYRNNSTELRRILGILRAENFYVAPSQHDDLNEEFLAKLDDDRLAVLSSQLEKKIDNEARILYLLALSVSMTYVIVTLNNGGFPADDYSEAFFNSLIKPKEMEKVRHIKESLRKAYSHDETDRVGRKVCLSVIYDYCLQSEKYINNLKKKNGVPTESNTSLKKRFQKKRTNFQEYIAKQMKDQESIVNDALSVIPKFFNKHKYALSQVEYIKKNLYRWLCMGAKIQKNDVYDILFLYSFSEWGVQSFNTFKGTSITRDDVILVSYDERLSNHIVEISPKSKVFMDRYVLAS